MNKNKIYYITYQDFPANTANSSQTIATCKYLNRNKYYTTLFFPLRSSKSSDNQEEIKSFYEIKDDYFSIKGIEHKTTFKERKIFKRFGYIFGHAYWSLQACNNVLKNYDKPNYFFTRSDWVFYFLSKKRLNVVYECHQITQLRKLLLRKAIKNKNSKIIFLNEFLLKDSKISQKHKQQYIIQNNGYDSDFFYNKNTKKSKNVIFAGNLIRLGQNRDIDFIINAFNDNRLKDFRLKIIGGNEAISSSFQSKYSIYENVQFISHQSKEALSTYLNESEIALLLNTKNKHSMFYTDPLKFYEYKACGLKIVGANFPSHQRLLKYKNLYLFEYGNKDSFIEVILKTSINELTDEKNLSFIDINKRVKNIINFIK